MKFKQKGNEPKKVVVVDETHQPPRFANSWIMLDIDKTTKVEVHDIINGSNTPSPMDSTLPESEREPVGDSHLSYFLLHPEVFGYTTEYVWSIIEKLGDLHNTDFNNDFPFLDNTPVREYFIPRLFKEGFITTRIFQSNSELHTAALGIETDSTQYFFRQRSGPVGTSKRSGTGHASTILHLSESEVIDYYALVCGTVLDGSIQRKKISMWCWLVSSLQTGEWHTNTLKEWDISRPFYLHDYATHPLTDTCSSTYDYRDS
ncbi:hypothetical protein HN615_05300 [Candidatus Woesearchaeota archaeon]|nr:hypothetical protein [Candidatus Woesearchaeota archaeon]